MKIQKSILIALAGAALTTISANAAIVISSATGSGTMGLSGSTAAGATVTGYNWTSDIGASVTGASVHGFTADAQVALTTPSSGGSIGAGVLGPVANIKNIADPSGQGGNANDHNYWYVDYAFTIGDLGVGNVLNISTLNFSFVAINSAGAFQNAGQFRPLQVTAEFMNSSSAVLASSVLTGSNAGGLEGTWTNYSLDLSAASALSAGTYTLRMTVDRDTTKTPAGGWGATKDITLNGDVVAVPEPSTYALIAGAVGLGLVALRRRKNR